MRQDKVLLLVGLATKAGKTVSGEFMTEREVKSGRAALVILAGDSSENTRKKFCNMGKEFRASLAILDEGFADGIQKQMKGNDRQLHKGGSI